MRLSTVFSSADISYGRMKKSNARDVRANPRALLLDKLVRVVHAANLAEDVVQLALGRQLHDDGDDERRRPRDAALATVKRLQSVLGLWRANK